MGDIKWGWDMRFEHYDENSSLIWEQDWNPNQMVNEGYLDIWTTYFKSNAAFPKPSDGEIYMGLYTNASGMDKEQTLAEITEPSAPNGYARIAVHQADITIGVETVQEYWTTTQETFTASGGAWAEVLGAFICVNRAAQTDSLLCFDPFATGRTLQDGDSLKVTVKAKRQDPT